MSFFPSWYVKQLLTDIRSAGGDWRAMHDCSREGLGFLITTTKDVHRDESGRIVPVEATEAERELTRALVFNPLSAAFAGIAAILGMFTYAIDPCLCLSIVSLDTAVETQLTVPVNIYYDSNIHLLRMDRFRHRYHYHPEDESESQ